MISLIVLTIIFAVVAPSLIDKSDFSPSERYYLPSFQLSAFSSYAELKSFLQVGLSGSSGHYVVNTAQAGIRTSGGKLNELKTMYGFSGSDWESSENLGGDYSETNVQVKGVDEADIVKTDGEFIYIISGSCLTIIKAYPTEEAGILSKIYLNGTIKGTFINNDILALFEETKQSLRTSIKIYDILDRKNPKLTREISYDGYYLNSRMIGNYVYAVINKAARIVNSQVALPKRYYDNWIKIVTATEIHYCDILDYSYTFTTIVAINIKTLQDPSEETILLGNANTMYVSLYNIYITFKESGRTLIYRIHIEKDKIKFVATGEVPGYILNQFSMDEHRDHFRIATMHNRASHVYVLNMKLNIIGRLENLAPRETMHSARFMGNRCYLVTFKKIDPLFVIDLEQPNMPTVLGQLKITGYSDYLQPYNETCIIGIGKETAGGNTNFAWFQGVKISLFDVSNVENPKEIAKCEIGDRGTDSPVLRDHKALLFDKSKALLVIPVLVAEINNTKYPDEIPLNTHGDFVWQGVYVFHISPERGIILKGGITHLEETTCQPEHHSQNYVKRSLYINNVLYTLSDSMLKMNNLENLDEINRIELAD